MAKIAQNAAEVQRLRAENTRLQAELVRLQATVERPTPARPVPAKKPARGAP